MKNQKEFSKRKNRIATRILLLQRGMMWETCKVRNMWNKICMWNKIRFKRDVKNMWKACVNVKLVERYVKCVDMCNVKFVDMWSVLICEVCWYVKCVDMWSSVDMWSVLICEVCWYVKCVDMCWYVKENNRLPSMHHYMVPDFSYRPLALECSDNFSFQPKKAIDDQIRNQRRPFRREQMETSAAGTVQTSSVHACM